MGWVLRLVESGVEGSSRSVEVLVIDPSGDLDDIAALGLTLAQGKKLVALVQQAIVTAQSRHHALRRPECRPYVAAATKAGWNTKYRALSSRLSDKPLTNKNI
jgi:hypothetical protein